MALNSFTVGTGGTYTTIAQWYGARRLQVASGDIEEAVLLDGNHDWSSYQAGWNAVDFTLRLRGQTAQDGNWTTGARIVPTGAFNLPNRTNNTTLEFQDLVIDLPSSFAPVVITTNNSTIDRDTTFNFTDCLCDLNHTLTVDGGNTPGQTFFNFTNCVAEGVSNPSRIVQASTSASNAGDYVVTLTASTITDSYVRLQTNTSNTSANGSVDVHGCLVSIQSTIGFAGRLVWNTSSAYARGGNSTDCITTENSTNHAAWATGTVTNPTYEAVFNFDGSNPATGEVSYTGGTGDKKDYSLVDHADNLAVDYATNATMPTLDILGETRDTSPDAGAYEIIADEPPPDPPDPPDPPVDPDPEMTTKVSTGMLKQVATSATNDTTALDTANAGKVVQLNSLGAIPSVYFSPMVDQWKLSGNLTGSHDPISTNLSRVIKLGGDSMTNTSGVFTFPKTGIYKVEAVFSANLSAAAGFCEASIWKTTDLTNPEQPTYTRIVRGFESGVNTLPDCNIAMTGFVDVTDTAECAVKFVVSQSNTGNSLRGSASYSETHFTFTRIGDT